MHVAGGAVLLLVHVVVVALAPSAAADAFCDNFNLLAATLPQNTSSSPIHFVTASAGQAPDAAYVLAVCPGAAVSDSACGGCVADMVKRYQQCPYRRWIYFHPSARCAGAGSDDVFAAYNITTDMASTPYETWNIKNITDAPGDAAFVAAFVRRLLTETVRRAAADAGRRYATGSMESGRNFAMLYSMAWCTPDMAAGDCSACLGRLTGTINSTMYLRMGGQMGSLRCYFRYEGTKFYDGETTVRLSVATPPAAAPAPSAPTTGKHKGRMNKLWIIPMAVVPLLVASLCFIFCSPWLRRYRGKARSNGRRADNLLGENSEFSVFEFDQIMEATDNFSEESKLGQGGFGAVYKGKLSDGQEIAVKRLASHSKQGFMEFKTEIQLIAKLQHRNLVRLLGCSIQGEEKLLIYEYLPNKSLDFFIFGDSNRALLDWCKRFTIIEGIACGLLYLHKHSRLSIIHRDLKPSNILLDGDMNPKISDFGLARIFSSDSAEGNNTKRVVGTYGYMAPEYSSAGIFSVKSDVFSFGVLTLEILTGRRNSGSRQYEDFINLLGYAWQMWQDERWLELMDPALVIISEAPSEEEEMRRCVNMALLCVQESASDRPTMADVVAMLSSRTMAMAEPKHPGYYHARVGDDEDPEMDTKPCSSVNDMTITVLSAR